MSDDASTEHSGHLRRLTALEMRAERARIAVPVSGIRAKQDNIGHTLSPE